MVKRIEKKEDDLMKKIWSLSETTSRIGTAGEKGTGYGMPLAREFVEKMSGKVIIKSIVKTHESQDHGTSIKILLLKKPHL